jgi:HK97 family phage prohead protease
MDKQTPELDRRATGGRESRVDISIDRKIRGNAIVFNSLSENLGGFREIITPTAVTRTLDEGSDVFALWNHNTDMPLGRRNVNLDLQKGRDGLRVVITPLRSFPDEKMDLVANGIVTGMSFRFRVLDDEWSVKDGLPLRTVKDMTFDEVSLVTFPAYPGTFVEVSKRTLDALSEFRAQSASRSVDLRRRQLQTLRSR